MGIRDTISHTSASLSGAILGAAAMYMLDPQQGNRRRALARDKAMRGGRLLLREARKRAKDMANRAYGQGAELVSGMRDRRSDIDDQRLVERVRAQLGHVCGHPGSLDVTARDGVVTVSGPVMRGEARKIENRLRETRGIGECRLRLQEHDSPADIPGLQGQPRGRKYA